MGRRLAIIPARGGSKRIINKNIRDFCGKPMISHILESAIASKLFDCIHVSTESSDICKVVESMGLTVHFPRPVELADDRTPLMPVLKFVTDKFAAQGELFDQVWLLMACAPLIDANDFKGAADLFDSRGGAEPLLAIGEYPVPIEWAFSRLENGRIIPVMPGKFAIPSQDLGKKFFDTGSFAIYPSKFVRSSKGAGSDLGYIGYILPKYKAIDIDDEEDWKVAEALYRYLSSICL
ncbi:MAG: acylneuraminate cytidylyltransferase family protein [Dissulfurispiraceae bacterium]|jgi:N-acylneuraminate cytidylyltransferase|nr:acylneuraminate cytidylyltransferase family protein [Dissulfurispiraceae bacterium]